MKKDYKDIRYSKLPFPSECEIDLFRQLKQNPARFVSLLDPSPKIIRKGIRA